MKTFVQWAGYFNKPLDKIKVADKVEIESLSGLTIKNLISCLQGLAVTHGEDSIYEEEWYSREHFEPILKKVRLETDDEFNQRFENYRNEYEKYVKNETKQKESDRIKDEINALTIKLRELQRNY